MHAEVADLATRWKKARIAAILCCVQSPTQSDDEIELLRCVSQSNRDAVLKAVFENSRKLGQSYSRYYGVSLEKGDLREMLPKLEVTCLKGDWYQRDDALVRERVGCTSGLKLGSYYCDYFRESIEGLTLGLTEDTLFARHASCRHSDDRCLDVWFDENRGLKKSDELIPLPAWATRQLQELQQKLSKESVQIDFEGVREGVLHYQVTTTNAPSCSNPVDHAKIVADEISKFWPGIGLKDSSPKAVFGKPAKMPP